MVTIQSNFIGNFKLGDNIAFNLDTLAVLYKTAACGNAYTQTHLRKPKIILIVSIIEAVLYDFHVRMQQFTREGVVNLPQTILDYVRGKKLDEFEKYIASARKHDIFGLTLHFYNDLDELRRLRNRVHIQNEKKHFESDDRIAFSDARLVLAERALEAVLLLMSEKYPRNYNHVAPFKLPWDARFPDGKIN